MQCWVGCDLLAVIKVSSCAQGVGDCVMREEAAVVEFEAELNSVEPGPEASGWRRVDDRYMNCPVGWRHAESGDEVLVFAETAECFVVVQRPASSGVLNRVESFEVLERAVQFVEVEVLGDGA